MKTITKKQNKVKADRNRGIKIKSFAFLMFLVVFSMSASFVQAAPNVNIFSSDFKLSVCDGPAGAGHVDPNDLTSDMKPGYVPCDFRGLMLQAQFLITVMISVGALAALVSLMYVGYLYITGTSANKNAAKDLLQRVGWGFLMMFSAWFIVYQILDWLVANDGVKVLLGSPN